MWFIYMCTYIEEIHRTAAPDILRSDIFVWRQGGKLLPLFQFSESRGPLNFNPYPTAFPYGNGMVLHFYQQQESSTTKTVHKVINKGLKTYV